MGRNASKALEKILHERIRQMGLHGVDEHQPSEWVRILANEFHSFAMASHREDRDGMRHEAIQIAAVAVAVFESIERGTT